MRLDILRLYGGKIYIVGHERGNDNRDPSEFAAGV